jgi:hypothetical protein
MIENAFKSIRRILTAYFQYTKMAPRFRKSLDFLTHSKQACFEEI